MLAATVRQRRGLRARALRRRDLAGLRRDDEREVRVARLHRDPLRQPLRPPRRRSLHYGARPAAHLRRGARRADVRAHRGLGHLGPPRHEQTGGAHARDHRLPRRPVEPRVHGRQGGRRQDGLHARGWQVPRGGRGEQRAQDRRRGPRRRERPRRRRRHAQLLRHEEPPHVGLRRLDHGQRGRGRRRPRERRGQVLRGRRLRRARLAGRRLRDRARRRLGGGPRGRGRPALRA